METTGFLCALLSLSTFGLGGTWRLLEGTERLGCGKPLDVHQVGERLEGEVSSFEATVFKGPVEPLGALLEGAAEPLDAILWGLAEPLEAVLWGSAEPLHVSEHLTDSHGTRASADTVPDFPEVDTDPGPPEERTLDSVVLCGRSKNNQVKDV